MTTVLIAIAAFTPLAGSAAVLAGARSAEASRRAGRWCTNAAGIATLAAMVLVVLAGVDESGRPAGQADLPELFALGLDRASALLLLAVTGTGLVCASFSRRSLDAAERSSRYFALLGGVVTGSALVVIPNGPLFLIGGWILASWSLVGLTVGWVDHRRARAATLRLAVSMTIGDVALTLAVVVAVTVAGAGVTSGSPDAVRELLDGSFAGLDAALVVSLLLVVAGAARSAMLPFHRWLVGTLYAPSPVSAIVHAGFVSGAGILLIRFAGVVVPSDAAVIAAFVLAVATVGLGVGASWTRPDVKGALAWSTVAQMAFMVAQVAVGAFAGAVFHIVGHGMYKAALFLGAGGTVIAKLQERRSPAGLAPLAPGVRAGASLAIPTVAVAVAAAMLPPDGNDAARLVVIVFAWLALGAATRGWLDRRPLPAGPRLAVATGGAVVLAVAYFGGLWLVKRYLDPSLPPTELDTAVGPAGVVIAIAVVGSVAAIGWRVPRARAHLRRVVVRLTDVQQALRLDGPAAESETIDVVVPTPADRSAVILDVNAASSIVAPQWPLASFVAVNPLTGIEAEGFNGATETARRFLRARTHQSIAQFRVAHERGVTSHDDLDAAIRQRLPEIGVEPSPTNVGRVLADLLWGPIEPALLEPRTQLERRIGVDAAAALEIDALLGDWIAAYVAPATWPLAEDGESLVAMVRRLAADEARSRVGSAAAARWLDALPDDPVAMIHASLAVADVSMVDRVDELRGHLASISGWAGIAKWRSEWAHPGEATPAISPTDVVAARCMIEAAVLIGIGSRRPATAEMPSTGRAESTEQRVSAVIEQLGLDLDDDPRPALRELLGPIDDHERSAIWLAAQERAITRSFATRLRDDPVATVVDPDAQVVFCIDVRSEGLRRHLEAQGHDHTIGFAGFFGVPMRVRELGWSHAEARCPVLVSPALTATEGVTAGAERELDAELRVGRLTAATGSAHSGVKHDLGAPFATAEAVGWALGPLAAAKTLLPSRAELAPTPHGVPSEVRFDDGMSTSDLVGSAEAVLRTMGLVDGFAPLVVLCGHTSHTVNNPHATALECGACAGASGAANARAVATMLNDDAVRSGLRERGIDVPDATWFLPGLHDTASDVVELLDVHLAPASHEIRVAELRRRLAIAGRNQAAVRAAHLPGSTHRVRDRGLDWAQVRPEWGLARNAAFVIAPRAVTERHDLEGRAFLHSYERANDPTGRILETIMTAPLVVGHWIASQYYFSTVDPEVFGAGDKLVHNPIGALGVVSGPGGDVRVGFPLQSTHVDGRPHHQAVRLLAAIQAEPELIDDIISRNAILQRLVGGSWIRIIARADAGDPWLQRSAGGEWVEAPTDHDPSTEPAVEQLPHLEET